MGEGGVSSGAGAGGSGCGSPASASSSNCCLSIITVVVAIASYILLGATAFFYLENDSATSRELSLPKLLMKSRHGFGGGAAASSSSDLELESLRNSTVQRLWVLTLELNVFYESNWTSLAELELQKFQDELLRFMFNKEQQLLAHQKQQQQQNLQEFQSHGGNQLDRDLYDENALHNFPAALLYCLTLITTIGYGSVSPKSMTGRILTVLYATVGIPLTLCYLATVGDYFARCIRKAYVKIVKRGGGGRNKSYGVPIPVSLILLILYLAGGAGVFWWLEGWSFIDALFFCFASLATIGFGGMLDPHSKHISLLISSVYILLGMALISTVFNLIQDEIVRRRSDKRDGRYHRPIS